MLWSTQLQCWDLYQIIYYLSCRSESDLAPHWIYSELAKKLSNNISVAEICSRFGIPQDWNVISYIRSNWFVNDQIRQVTRFDYSIVYRLFLHKLATKIDDFFQVDMKSVYSKVRSILGGPLYSLLLHLKAYFNSSV